MDIPRNIWNEFTSVPLLFNKTVFVFPSSSRQIATTVARIMQPSLSLSSTGVFNLYSMTSPGSIVDDRNLQFTKGGTLMFIDNDWEAVNFTYVLRQLNSPTMAESSWIWSWVNILANVMTRMYASTRQRHWSRAQNIMRVLMVFRRFFVISFWVKEVLETNMIEWINLNAVIPLSMRERCFGTWTKWGTCYER